ncbi:MAG TPA: enolase C-terminal domain-like protein [Thermoanaerobaculia bacterium]|jgi:O-succinylbenzoate synthase
MQIAFWRYTLKPRRRLSGVARDGVREGALLRVGDGYADVHPWPELGDAPLDEQLARLSRGELTPLTRAALHHAQIDGEARRRGISLFAGLTIPESHWPGPDPPPGFDTVKLKSIDVIPNDVRLRIDFNARLTPDEFVRIAQKLPRERIDFIEDPCPYDAKVWRDLEHRTNLRLALDRSIAPPTAPAPSVIIHKPALSATFPQTTAEVVVTSYMDHPLGQFTAAYIAATNNVSPRCGLFTHTLYDPDQFIETIHSTAARLHPPPGTGIGFDDLLAKVRWSPLN